MATHAWVSAEATVTRARLERFLKVAGSQAPLMTAGCGTKVVVARMHTGTLAVRVAVLLML
jgi:hypothetical protein